MKEHSIIKLRALIEGRRDTRLLRLLKKVNNPNQGDGRDLQALHQLAERSGKYLIWYYKPYKAAPTEKIRIWEAYDELPKGVTWYDVHNLYGNRRKPGKPKDEIVFRTHETIDPTNLYTYREIVHANSWKGFDIIEKSELK